MLAGLYPLLVYEVLKKFLQSQQVVYPQMFIAIVANVYTFGANYGFIYGLDMGHVGASVARTSTNILLCVLGIIYTAFVFDHKETWGGWSLEAFSRWGEFLKIGIPGMLMLCLEWWAFEIMSFLAGILGTTELAAHSVTHLILLLLLLPIAAASLFPCSFLLLLFFIRSSSKS